MAFSSGPRPAIGANLALAAVLVAVLSGCVAAPPQPTVSTTAADASGPRVEVNADGLLAVFAPRMDLSLQARLGGELIELEGGCIGVADGSASGALVLWPSTARLVGEEIEFDDGRRVKVGDTLDVSGGGFSEWDFSAPQPCTADSFIAVAPQQDAPVD